MDGELGLAKEDVSSTPQAAGFTGIMTPFDFHSQEPRGGREGQEASVRPGRERHMGTGPPAVPQGQNRKRSGPKGLWFLDSALGTQ